MDCCGNCKFLTNVPDDKRDEPNVMGGCFKDGRIVFTDSEECNDFISDDAGDN
jgi:hypothetical protein